MPESRRLALLVEYDGTAFAGSQAQPQRRTVQDTLEAALRAFTGERQRIAFAGRTDAGVHALGQVAALDTTTAHSPRRFHEALNHFLPEDVAVRAVREVASDFDPRRDAVRRSYRYEIVDGRVRSPLRRQRALHVSRRLDSHAMSEAAQLLPSAPRDWSAFAGRVPEGYSTVRSVRCTVMRCGAHSVVVTMQAEGFLPHQVRRTVGALMRVGTRALAPSEFAALVDGPPMSAGPAAPPHGLTLMAVEYPPGMVDWNDDEDLPPPRE